ncbi:MAG TPA: zinc ABC transporter substrate-binding protein, partial [Anaerolineaceae bacterium]|nr:zinc ABC transporter substrate-binding protein [Anaerolineaceae bacterium]
MPNRINLSLLAFLILVLSLSACAPAPAPVSDRITVVATTSILADVVSRIGGDLVSVTALVPPGANEHAYQPSPRDIAAVSDAALVFEVGLGLEGGGLG